ncbi:MAG: S8/S53 family peptidase [Thermoanaerobaculia bacterium]|nr:S8/S53 family peptidase [Thermoanaerobaculia bacterium]
MLRSPARCWSLAVLLLVPVRLWSLPGEVSWAWTPERLAPAEGELLIVPCGFEGTFGFQPADRPWDGALGIAKPQRATPAPYPSPGSSRLTPAQLHDLESVFTPPASTPGPWVAVIDWRGWHGTSVGAAIRQYSGGRGAVTRFPLDDPAVTQQLGSDVTDAHVLVQLCRLLDDVEMGHIKAPTAINLSFGRLATEGDPASAEGCIEEELACQVARILDRLSRLEGDEAPPTIVAAAGNHGSWLFPAALDSVLATGLPDLLRSTPQTPTASWETPEPTRPLILAPAAGLCLLAAGHAWTAPAGSSFSTALVSAWLAETDPGDRLPMLTEAFFDPEDRLRLTPGASVLTGVWAAELYLRKTSARVHCDAAEGWGSVPIVAPIDIGLSAPPNFPSLVEIVSSTHRPAPEPTPCVPCRDIRVPPPSAATFAAQSSKMKVSTDGKGPELDLGAPWPLGQDIEILAIHLRLDDRFYQLTMPDALLSSLRTAQPLSLKIPWSRFEPASQASLVFIVRNETDVYWNSVPIIPAGLDFD